MPTVAETTHLAPTPLTVLSDEEKMFQASVRRFAREQIGPLFALHADVHRRSVPDCLIDDTIAFGQFEKLVELFLRCVRIDFEV